MSQDPSTEQRYQMEPPEQGQNYSVNIPLTTDVSLLLIRFVKITTQCAGPVRGSGNWHLLPCVVSSSTLCPGTRRHDEHLDPEGPHQGLQEGQGGQDRRQQVRGRGEEGAVQEVGVRQGESEDERHEQVFRAGWSLPSTTIPTTQSTFFNQLNFPFCRFSWWTVPRSCGNASPSSSLRAKDFPRLSHWGSPSSTSNTWSTYSGRCFLKTVLFVSSRFPEILKHKWHNILSFPASLLTRESLHRLWSLTQARKLGTVSPIHISPGMHYASHIRLFLWSASIHISPGIHPIWLNWLKLTCKLYIWKLKYYSPGEPCSTL